MGLREILATERNARIHLASAIAVLVLGLALNVSNGELAALFFAIILVFLAEIMNTSIEKTLDLVHPAKDERVRRIKDMAAGAVLVTAAGSAIVGLVIFWPYLLGLLWR